MVFVDSNVVMYLVGAAHENRNRLVAYLRERPDDPYVTSAEVYQELIHRYLAIDRRSAIADAFALLDALVEEVFPVRLADARRAHEISLAQMGLSGRDCLHLAVMEHRHIDSVLTMDRGFDLWPGTRRVP